MLFYPKWPIGLKLREKIDSKETRQLLREKRDWKRPLRTVFMNLTIVGARIESLLFYVAATPFPFVLNLYLAFSIVGI